MSSAPISQTVGIGDPDKPANTLKINDNRSIDVVVVSGGGGATEVNLTLVDGDPISLGQKAMAASLPVVLASDQSNVPENLVQIGGASYSQGLKARATSAPVVIADINAGEYETVAASQTAQVLGATGATGDYLSGLLVVPATTSPGNVLLLDNATSITVFTGGASSVVSLIPFFIPLGMYSVSGAWKVTTGTNVSVIGIGNFT